MVIGTTAAIIGSAVIGAGASAIASSKNSKAINQSTAAQTESNAQSVALQRDIYGQNKAALDPFLQRGNKAGDAYNALLGLGGGTTPQVQQPTNTFAFGGGVGDFDPSMNIMDIDRGHYGGGRYGPVRSMQYGQPQAVPEAQANTVQSPLTAQQAAFDAFRGSTGYQFRLNEGTKAINSGYAAGGTLQSGAALKALQRYGQDYGSNEFGNYMGYLGNQQGVGLQAGSALAGVGQSYANNVTALNASNANALSNAAVAKANNSNALIGSIGGIAGNALGYFAGGSSYRG